MITTNWRPTSINQGTKSLGKNTEMKTLLFGLVVYLLGIAGILFYRPRFMFHADGRWKEFGMEDGTMFPFWMFCIVWAILSYVIARTAVGDSVAATVASNIVASNVALSNAQISIDDDIPDPPSELELPVKPRRNNASGKTTMKPGYYRLSGTNSKGVPEYVYFRPPDAEETA